MLAWGKSTVRALPGQLQRPSTRKRAHPGHGVAVVRQPNVKCLDATPCAPCGGHLVLFRPRKILEPAAFPRFQDEVRTLARLFPGEMQIP